MLYHILISRHPGVITQFRLLKKHCNPWRYQAAFATGQGIKRIIYIYIYIYTPDPLNAETTLDVNLHFLSAVCDLKNAFTFGGWCYYAFTVTVSYVITRERWFLVCYLHAENFLAFDQIQLDAYRAVFWRRFEATFKLRPVIPIFENRNIYIYISIYILIDNDNKYILYSWKILFCNLRFHEVYYNIHQAAKK